MISVNSVTAAVYTVLSSDSAIAALGYLIELSPPLNADPNRTPWIGVLEGRTVSTPHTIGGLPRLHGYEGEGYIPPASALDGKDLEQRLSAVKVAVLTAVNSNKQLTVDGTNYWDMIRGAESEPYDRRLIETAMIGTYKITLMG